MPRQHKDPAEKLDKGVTVLFTKDHHARIDNYARAHGISMGEAIRRLTDTALRS